MVEPEEIGEQKCGCQYRAKIPTNTGAVRIHIKKTVQGNEIYPLFSVSDGQVKYFEVIEIEAIETQLRNNLSDKYKTAKIIYNLAVRDFLKHLYVEGRF